jgi:hypothetical protein
LHGYKFSATSNLTYICETIESICFYIHVLG